MPRLYCRYRPTISCASCAPSPAPLITSTATANFVHAFIAARLDNCSTLYAGLPEVRLVCLARVFHTAARLVGGILRTGHVSGYMLNVRIPLATLPTYFASLLWSGGVWPCTDLRTSNIFAVPPRAVGHQRPRSSLCSMERGVLSVSFARTSTRQARAFSADGPSVWNELQFSQQLLPRVHSDIFYSSLKTVLFSRAGIGSASE